MKFEFELGKKIQRGYEGVLLVHPDAKDEDQKALLKKTKAVVESFGGKWNHCDTWGKRRLANPINKLPRAQYFHYTFTADTQAVAEVERTLRINEAVLRFHHLRLDDRTTPEKHVELYKRTLQDSVNREKERAEKSDKKRQQQQQQRRA